MSNYVWEKSYPPGVKWELDVPSMTIHQSFEESCARYGDRPFTDFLDKVMTFRDYKEASDRAAAGFRSVDHLQGGRCIGQVGAVAGSLEASAAQLGNGGVQPGCIASDYADSGAFAPEALGAGQAYAAAAARNEYVFACKFEIHGVFPAWVWWRMETGYTAHRGDGTHYSAGCAFRCPARPDFRPWPRAGGSDIGRPGPLATTARSLALTLSKRP